MNKEPLNKIKEQLLREKKNLKYRLKRIAKEDPKVKNRIDFDAIRIEVGDDEDENAFETALFDTNVALEQRLENVLNDINKTLEKIKRGSYGICDKCGKEISPKRLEAFPIARLCIKCKKNKKWET